MSNKVLEQASAFIDGELADAEAPLFLERLQRDTELRATLGRHELIGEAMRGTLPAQCRDFAAGVMAAIENIDAEAPQAASPGAARRVARFGQPVAGLAVAASVAMLAIFTLQGPVGAPMDSAVPVEVVPGTSAIASNPVLPARQVDFSNVRSPELQNQLRGYLMNHNEHAGNSRLRGVMPYVQIAAQDSRPLDDETSPVADEESLDSNGGTLPNDPQF